MSAWKMCRIGDLCDTISETYKRTDNMVVLINTSDVLEGEVLNHTPVPNENLKGQFKKTFQRDDILYSEIRPANKRFAFIDFEDTSKYIASTKLMVLRPRKAVVLPLFLYAILKSRDVLEELQHLAETRSGTFPQITFSSELAPMEIMLPDFTTQKQIVGILSAIEDKIRLNTAINENLEQQIYEYFKEKFPDVLIENGKEALGKLISFSNGKKRPDEEGQIPVYGGNGILAYTNKANASNCVIIGRVGAYCGNVCLSLDDCWISDNAISAKSKISKSQLFVFNILKSAHLPNRHIGSGQPLMTQGILNAIPCIVPKEKEIVDFEEKMTPLQNMISINNQENLRLATLRDTLLPKLMNGEIDVSVVKI